MSLHSMSLRAHPSLRSLLKAKMYPLQLNSWAWMHHVCLLVFFSGGETKISVRSNRAALPNTSTFWREGRYYRRYLGIVGNLEYTVNLKPLISSVSSPFHHVLVTFFIADSQFQSCVHVFTCQCCPCTCFERSLLTYCSAWTEQICDYIINALFI